MQKAIVFALLVTFSLASFAAQQPNGIKTAVALSVLRTVKCERLNVDAISNTKRQLGAECNYLAEEFHMRGEQIACETQLQYLDGLVRNCDARKFKAVADNISEIIKRAMHNHKK